MEIHFKSIYLLKDKSPILVIYNISSKHYIGIPIYKSKFKNSNYIPSIDFHYSACEISEYKYGQFINCLYVKGSPLFINDLEFKAITDIIKQFFLNNILLETSDNTIDNFIFDKWIFDKLYLNNNKREFLTMKLIRSKALYWVNFGYGVGSELRKLRPAILWRHTSDKKICTFIPLSSKCFGDSYYYHCDMVCLNKSTAKLECLQNLSYKRIVESYMLKGNPVYISIADFKIISENLKKYYLYN